MHGTNIKLLLNYLTFRHFRGWVLHCYMICIFLSYLTGIAFQLILSNVCKTCTLLLFLPRLCSFTILSLSLSFSVPSAVRNIFSQVYASPCAWSAASMLPRCQPHNFALMLSPPNFLLPMPLAVGFGTSNCVLLVKRKQIFKCSSYKFIACEC
jgi:hypothetical protein